MCLWLDVDFICFSFLSYMYFILFHSFLFSVHVCCFYLFQKVCYRLGDCKFLFYIAVFCSCSRAPLSISLKVWKVSLTSLVDATVCDDDSSTVCCLYVLQLFLFSLEKSVYKRTIFLEFMRTIFLWVFVCEIFHSLFCSLFLEDVGDQYKFCCDILGWWYYR